MKKMAKSILGLVNDMWFNIIKIKRLTGRMSSRRHAKDIIDKYLLTVEIGHKFFSHDVLEFAKVNNLLEGIEHKMSVKLLSSNLQQNVKVVIDSRVRRPNTKNYANKWEKVK